MQLLLPRRPRRPDPEAALRSRRGFDLRQWGTLRATWLSLSGPRIDVGHLKCLRVGGNTLMNDGSTVWAHHIELPARAPSASRARGFVVQHLVEHDLPHLADDLQLVVTELATNALIHALTPFTVTLEAFAHIVLLGVQDGSLHAPVMRACVPRDTSGRGIQIVELLSRDWGVTAHADGGKTVWAAFATWDSPRACEACDSRNSGSSRDHRDSHDL
jgi:hypothetical protein